MVVIKEEKINWADFFIDAIFLIALVLLCVFVEWVFIVLIFLWRFGNYKLVTEKNVPSKIKGKTK